MLFTHPLPQTRLSEPSPHAFASFTRPRTYPALPHHRPSGIRDSIPRARVGSAPPLARAGLPNATKAAFWVRRAAAELAEGRAADAARTLQEGLLRNAQPVRPIHPFGPGRLSALQRRLRLAWCPYAVSIRCSCRCCWRRCRRSCNATCQQAPAFAVRSQARHLPSHKPRPLVSRLPAVPGPSKRSPLRCARLPSPLDSSARLAAARLGPAPGRDPAA